MALRKASKESPLEKMLADQENSVLKDVSQETREAMGAFDEPAAPAPVEEPAAEPPAPEPVAEPPAPAPEPAPEPAAPAAPAAAPPAPEPAPAPVAAAPVPAPAAPDTEAGKFPWREFRKLQRQAKERETQPPVPVAETPAPAAAPVDDDDPLGVKAAARAVIQPELDRIAQQQEQFRQQQEQQRQQNELQQQEATFRATHPEGKHYDEAATYLIKSARDEYETSGADRWKAAQLLKGAETNEQIRTAIEQVADKFDISDDEAARRIAVDLYVTDQYQNIRNGALTSRRPLPEVVFGLAKVRGFAPAAPAAAPAPTPAPVSRVERARRLNSLGPSIGNMNTGGGAAPSKGTTPPKTKAEFERIVMDRQFSDELALAWDRVDPNWETKLA